MSLLLLDTLDDRREIWHLLHRLSPSNRVRFLGVVCAKVWAKQQRGPQPSIWRMADTVRQARRCERADTRLTNEIYGDILVTVSQYELDLKEIALELEQIVKCGGQVGEVKFMKPKEQGLWAG